jgi:carbon-monoxide dehydrogenase medium subunit
MNLREFIIPGTLREARSALKKLGEKGMAVAGGTALHFYGDMEKTAVDITRLGLSGIKKKGGAYLVGATTPVAELMNYRGSGWVLNQVGSRVSTQQIRNISTVGGNIVRIFPWADLPVALLALDAKFEIEGKKTRTVSADTFFEKQPAHLFKTDDLLTWIQVPVLKKGQGFGYRKENRVNASFSMMTAAAFVTVKGGKIKSVRLVAGAGIPFPRRLLKIEEALLGRAGEPAEIEAAVTEGIKGIAWKGKEGMSDDYAAQLARVILVDVLTEALQQAKGGAS